MKMELIPKVSVTASISSVSWCDERQTCHSSAPALWWWSSKKTSEMLDTNFKTKYSAVFQWLNILKLMEVTQLLFIAKTNVLVLLFIITTDVTIVYYKNKCSCTTVYYNNIFFYTIVYYKNKCSCTTVYYNNRFFYTIVYYKNKCFIINNSCVDFVTFNGF
jgi:hypothetical protein